MLPAYFAPCALDSYALLDSGDGAKLERFGEYVLARPDPQALWPKRLASSAWESADLAFVRESDRGGRWEGPGARLASWTVDVDGLEVELRPQAFKHVGLFPEQASNWSWLESLAREGGEVLNLFGYTGVASLIAARAGARVTHVDSSKSAIAWARANAERNSLELRTLVDDAVAFVEREVRRGRRYRGVLLDPPAYGRAPRRARGPKADTWRFERDIAPLLTSVGRLLDSDAFVCLSTYAIGTSPLSLANLIELVGPGDVAAGELVLAEAPRAGDAARLLPAGFTARWRREA
ncbi:MAG: class I SAM-dependent methyltransferase [Planctomycetota bacterium]